MIAACFIFCQDINILLAWLHQCAVLSYVFIKTWTRSCGLKIPILFRTFRGCSLSGLRSFLGNLSVYIQQNVEQPTFYREQETSKTRQLQIMIVSILQEWSTSDLIASLFWHFQDNIFEQLESLSSAFGHWSKFDILCCI